MMPRYFQKHVLGGLLAVTLALAACAPRPTTALRPTVGTAASGSIATSERALCDASENPCLANCRELTSRLTPTVATRAVACLDKAASGSTCVPPLAYACVRLALEESALDPHASLACDEVASECRTEDLGDDWRRACPAIFSGLTPSGRKEAIACLTRERCKAHEFFSSDAVASCIFDGHVA